MVLLAVAPRSMHGVTPALRAPEEFRGEDEATCGEVCPWSPCPRHSMYVKCLVTTSKALVSRINASTYSIRGVIRC